MSNHDDPIVVLFMGVSQLANGVNDMLGLRIKEVEATNEIEEINKRDNKWVNTMLQDFCL